MKLSNILPSLVFAALSLAAISTFAELPRPEAFTGTMKIQGRLFLNEGFFWKTKEEVLQVAPELPVQLRFSIASERTKKIEFILSVPKAKARDNSDTASSYNEYQFLVPTVLIQPDGNFSVHLKSSGQLAHLKGEKTVSEIPPTIEDRSVRCSRSGYCYRCGTGSNGKYSCGHRYSNNCSGRKIIRVQVKGISNVYKFNIYNDEGSAEIISQPQRIEETTTLAELSSCS